MDISLNGLWTNSYNFLKNKIANGLTQQEKKVALFAIAYFALATFGYILYRSFCMKAPKIEYSEPKKTEPRKTVEKLFEEEEAVVRSVDLAADELLTEKIAINNADQLRTLVNNFRMETVNLSGGQWRKLYLDAKGNIKGIKGPDGDPVWLDDKAEDDRSLFSIKTHMKKFKWDPSKGPAFEWEPQEYRGKLSGSLFNVVESMMDELNLLAKGAYNIALKNPPQDPLNKWMSIFADVDNYSSAILLSEADVIEGNSQADPSPKAKIKVEEAEDDEDKPQGSPKLEKEDKEQPSDGGLDHLIGMPLLKPIKVMPHIDFKLTPLMDDALQHLKGTPLTQIDFNKAVQLTDAALEHLKGLKIPPGPGDNPVSDQIKDAADSDPAVSPAPAPVLAKKKSIQEKLDDNVKDAKEQQAKEKSKGFKIVDGPIPDVVKGARGPLVSDSKSLMGIAVGSASCQGTRDTMEDADLVSEAIINAKDFEYGINVFGVFDGHGGDKASAFVKEHLMAYLKKELESHVLDDETIRRSLKDCFIKLDADYPGKDGTTATVAITIGGKLWVANVGDSRTILVKRNGEIIQASEDAKPTEERYKRGIEKKGGHVILGRVMGQLAVARAIGDKNVIGSNGDCVVSASPKIACYSLDDIEYLALACDGLTDVASSDEIGEAIKAMRDQGAKEEEMAKRLVYSAITRGSRDNVSVIVAKL